MEKVLYIEGRRTGYSLDQCGETMTVGELIDKLSQYDKNIPIYLDNDNGYTYGNIDNNSFVIKKSKSISIKEYLEKISIEGNPRTIDELVEITEKNFYWSFAIEDFDEIKYWGEIELVKDCEGNERFFETNPTLPF